MKENIVIDIDNECDYENNNLLIDRENFQCL